MTATGAQGGNFVGQSGVDPHPNPPPEYKGRGKKRRCGISISILILIVAIGGVLRCHKITKENLWIDEYRTLYLATGRGDSIYRLPLNQIIGHPPDVGFSDAPAWWYIWNGLNTTSHPPLYHILLRFWVDLLGDGDRSIRGMSTVFSLGCIVLMYVAVLKLSGDNSQALIAAGFMAFAPGEIYYSQQVRPYTLLQFIALAAGIILISIERRGWSRAKGILLSMTVLMLALTHYFCAGVIVAFGVYSIVRVRPGERFAVLSAIVIPVLVALVAWGPHIRNDSENGYGRIPNRSLLHLVLSVPQRLTLESNHDPLAMADNGSWPLVISIAAIAYLIPLFMLRRRRDLFFWWLWTVCAIGLVLAIDVVRHSTLLTMTRYVIPAAPGFTLFWRLGFRDELGNYHHGSCCWGFWFSRSIIHRSGRRIRRMWRSFRISSGGRYCPKTW